MSLPVQTVRQLYNGNGSTTTFAIPFGFFASTNNVRVVKRSSLGVETTQAYGTHYTIVSTNVVMNAAPASGEKILVIMDLDLAQVKSFSDNVSFLPSQMMDGLDRLAAQIQQVNELATRALKLSETSTYTNLTLPDPTANRALRWKADLSGLENVPLADITGPQGPQGPQGPAGYNGQDANVRGGTVTVNFAFNSSTGYGTADMTDATLTGASFSQTFMPDAHFQK